jgi:hypothetical protein
MVAPNYPDEQVEELKLVCGDVAAAVEGGALLFHLAALPLPEGCVPDRVEALLCPAGRDGYPSRLFFAQIPTSRSKPNWHMQARIMEKNWHVYSWRVPGSGHRLAQLVQLHLKALR